MKKKLVFLILTKFREKSRATRSGVVKVEVIDPKHRRFPLVQGGLEISSVKVVIEMENSTRGREILARFQTHIRDNYN